MSVGAGAIAAPPKLTVRPVGTNELVLTVSPVATNMGYHIFARTNGAEGHWINIAYVAADSNGMATTSYTLPDASKSNLAGFTLASLANWTLVAGYATDTDGDGLSDVYEDLVSRSDPLSGQTGEIRIMDGYRDSDDDGWIDLDELRNDTDPLRADQPLKPDYDVGFYPMTTNINGPYKAVITMSVTGAILPEYFLIEKARRTWQQPVEGPERNSQIPAPRISGSKNNRPPFGRTFPPRPGRKLRQDQAVITGPFEPLARVVTSPGLREYKYVDTNVDNSIPLQPVYQVRHHFAPPFRSFLNSMSTSGIRKSILSVKAQKAVDGYLLTALDPIPYARYLLLVRDRSHPLWRASGYFMSGTNRNPVNLKTGHNGMMTSSQKPIAMPTVRFAPVLIDPEFTAGWGEDSDGDGLPDIYEVLVTQSDPAKADTGNAGILDGYKDPDKDGWSSLEEFRRRTNPLEAEKMPAPVELKNPTFMAAIRLAGPPSDLPYEMRIEVRMAGSDWYVPLKQPLMSLYDRSNPRDTKKPLGEFDLQLKWQVPAGPISRPVWWP